MLYYLMTGDRIMGPYDEEFVVSAIDRGIPPDTLVRTQGESDWKALGDYAAFAHAMKRIAPTRPPPAPLRSGTVPKHRAEQATLPDELPDTVRRVS